MAIIDKLATLQDQKQTTVCVGLDPDLDKMPPHLVSGHSPAEAVVAFNRAIIEATAPFACAYKLNFAFFEALGGDGWQALEETRQMLPRDTISIADAKRGDIGNSGKFYAKSVFESLAFDTITVAPYMGMDSIQPFIDYPDKMAFVLGRTSNPGAADLQERMIDGQFLYEVLVQRLSELPAEHLSRTGLVVGATDDVALRKIRKIVPDMPFLIPGVGAQGGDPDSVVRAAYAGPGTILINSSRSILYADSSKRFAEAAAEEAKRLRGVIQDAIKRN